MSLRPKPLLSNPLPSPVPPLRLRARRLSAPLLAVPLLAILAGCSQDPGFVGVPGIREAEDYQVTQCRALSHISMTPGVYGPLLAQQGLSYARNKVKEDALAAGANTVVFDKVSPGSDVYVVRATAYAC